MVIIMGHAGVKGNDRADRLAGKTTLTKGLLLGRSEVLRSLRHYLRAQSQGHHTIDRQEERGVERRSARWSSLKGRERAIVNQTNIGTVSKATLGKLWETGWSAYGLFRAHRCRLELNWTELWEDGKVHRRVAHQTSLSRQAFNKQTDRWQKIQKKQQQTISLAKFFCPSFQRDSVDWPPRHRVDLFRCCARTCSKRCDRVSPVSSPSLGGLSNHQQASHLRQSSQVSLLYRPSQG